MGRINFSLLYGLLALVESMCGIAESPFVGGYNHSSLEEDLLHCSSTADLTGFKTFIVERPKEAESRKVGK